MKQKVITKEIEKAIQRTSYRSTDGQGGNAKVIVKLFYPRGNNAFLVTEGGQSDGEKWDGDSVYGWCKHDGFDYEAGCFSLKELLETQAEINWAYGSFKVGVERDTSVDVQKKTLLEVMGDDAPDFLKNPEEIEEKEEPVLDVLDVPDGTKIEPEPSEAVKEIVAVVEKVEPVETAQPENVKSGEWDAENWKRMTEANDHDGARVGIASWATNYATAEREEFALLLSDYIYVTAIGARGKDQELVDFRLELDEELKERVTRVYGEAKWAECAACL